MKGEDIRIVTKQEFLTSQILFYNNLAQNFLRRILLCQPGKTRELYIQTTMESERGRGGGGTLFCLDEMFLWEKVKK